MEINRGELPPFVQRDISVSLTRDELLTVLANYIKSKFGHQIEFSELSVYADEENSKLHSVTVSGKENVKLNVTKNISSSSSSSGTNV